MRENITISLQSILHHKLRAFLTMLGIIIGIAAIITIVSTMKGTNDEIKSKLIGAGNNVVTVTLQKQNGYYSPESEKKPDGVALCSEAVLEEIRTQPEVKNASMYCEREWSEGIYYQENGFSGRVLGVDEDYLTTCGYSLEKGRWFQPEDLTGYRKVALLDMEAANLLFGGDDPLNRTLDIRGDSFVVIGCVSPQKNGAKIESYEDYITYYQETSGTILIPITCWPIVYQFDEPQTIAVKAVNTDAMTQAGKRATELLNEHLVKDQNYTYSALDLQEQAAQMQDFATSTNRQLLWIAGISLLVGGIGVMNIMLVSVTERTREIGIKKAIGARKSRILMQFLTESGVLTCMGGILGVLMGIGLSFLLSGVMEMKTAISWPACVIAVAFSMLIGILFGIVPAVKAAKLNPIDALRKE